MPELAAMGAMNFLCCWLINGVAIWRLLRIFRSTSYQTLQANLAKAGWYWSEHQGELLELSKDGAVKQDQTQALRSLLILSTACAFASWAGVFFMSVFLISLRSLAKSRVERELEVHELTRNSQLTRAQVEEFVQKLREAS